MIFSALFQYKEIVKSYEIKKFNKIENAYELVASIVFIDDSELFINDYLFLNNKRYYSYHYQNKDKSLIFRYNTAPHHKSMATFPYHKHIPESVIESKVMSINFIFSEINELFVGRKQ